MLFDILKKIIHEYHTISISNSYDQDQAQYLVVPELEQYCLQRLSQTKLECTCSVHVHVIVKSTCRCGFLKEKFQTVLLSLSITRFFLVNHDN